MPEPKIDYAKSHVAVRLDVETLARLSKLLPLYALPGRTATMSDVLRAVILAGLTLEEGRLKNAPPNGSH
jgi:hypothetical protein